MKIEILSIGNELLNGRTVNTNASWMGKQLTTIGLSPRWVTAVGDDLNDMLQALRIAEERADAVLVTGGLGPTHDDVTKRAALAHFGGKLVLNQEVLDQVRARFRYRGIEPAPVNEEQAWVPDTAEIIPNRRGTAPGMIFRRNGRMFFFMPGVPFEMKEMMLSRVLPELKERAGGRALLVRNLMTTGIPESTLYSKLEDLEEILKDVQVAFLPDLYGVQVRLTAAGENESEAQERLARAEARVRAEIGAWIYADEEIPLEAAVARLLLAGRAHLAVAESCTGGLICNLFTNIPGSSEFFERGVIAYSNRAKTELLGVPEETIARFGAVSAETATAMAEGVRRLAGTDYGLSVTGIAGPSGGTPEKPVGLVFVACADRSGMVWERHVFADDRIGNKHRSAQAALNLLRRRMKGELNG